MLAKLPLPRFAMGAYCAIVLLVLGHAVTSLAEPVKASRRSPASIAAGGDETIPGNESSQRRIHRLLYRSPRRGSYQRIFHMTATAYMPIHEGIEGGRFTCTRRDGKTRHGVAVDPRIIPLGSRLWIPGYGIAVADDIGSGIKGHHVDVRVQERSQMHAWGKRAVKVYILADPPGA